MAIRKSRKNEKVVIDLNGPQGNAFYLMGIVRSMYRRAGASELGEHIVNQMKSGDYEHLLKTFDLYLGDKFDLVRD